MDSHKRTSGRSPARHWCAGGGGGHRLSLIELAMWPYPHSDTASFHSPFPEVLVRCACVP
jgi:hypothetical protein